MKNKLYFILAVCVLIFSACTVKYSLTGASISPETKTITVKYFPNRASVVNPGLSQMFTEALIDRMKSQTSLEFVDNYADVTFEGEIKGYNVKPTSIQQEGAAMNRFTITVKVKFTSLKDPDYSYESTFSHFEEFESSKTLADIENDGKVIEEIIEKLTEDIFNKAFSNW